MRAMVLSAGYGTRLWPLTEDRTKPAIPILGKPLVGYVAEYLARFGVDDIIVNLHHRPESVRKALGDGSQFGVKLQYVEEPEILGTSGALDNAKSFFLEDTFVVINGKIITDIDLTAALDTHRKSGAIATLVLLRNIKRELFTVVQTDNGLITGFGGMPSDDSQDPLMFTGIQFMEPAIFRYIPQNVFSHSTTDVYPAAMAAGEKIAAHVAKGRWYELSTLRRYVEISLELMKDAGNTISVGTACTIDNEADVRDAILWDRVKIDAGARVKRAVLADGVTITSGETIQNAVVVPAALVSGKVPPQKALRGHVVGENFVVPLTL
ncbi:MAG TPA: NDP-sugar synthase [Pyrinomonadaceae bacterium]|jgi:NDP-sugar pyrophosphorylase family protein|nr:NDP-sugar synthase [Pyrinomonadaceae bacterium]